MVIPAPAAGDSHSYLTPNGFVQAFGMFDHLTKGNLTLIGKLCFVIINKGSEDI